MPPAGEPGSCRTLARRFDRERPRPYAARAGSATVKRLPRPGSLCTVNVPPCASTSVRAMNSPSPSPSLAFADRAPRES